MPHAMRLLRRIALTAVLIFGPLASLVFTVLPSGAGSTGTASAAASRPVMVASKAIQSEYRLASALAQAAGERGYPGLGQSEADPLDGGVDRNRTNRETEPLDAQAEQAEAADPLDGPAATSIAVDPLDAPATTEIVDRPVQATDPLDAPAVGVVPVTPAPTTAPTVAESNPAPVAAVSEPVAAPVAAGKPVATTSSVRTKESESRTVVVNGTLPVPSSLASCGVAVTNGRLVVGTDCAAGTSVIGTQPVVPTRAGSSATIATETAPAITSHRDGVQIGFVPSPTLGDDIALTVRAAIFPEDVVVPDVLIVPGELTVAGNQAREDPIVLWRSELEAAAASTGVPVEYLASVIQVGSGGEPLAQSDHGVGLMQVPVAVLQARGIPPASWFDPAVNIAVGAELIAAQAAAGGSTEAAVSAYLAGGCDANDVCVINSTVDDWVVYYRLRVAGPTVILDAAPEPGDDQETTVATRVSTWPFDETSDDVGPAAANPATTLTEQAIQDITDEEPLSPAQRIRRAERNLP